MSARRPSRRLTVIAAVLWGCGLIILLASLAVATAMYDGSRSSDDYARLDFVMDPAIAAIGWIPLGLASLIVSIIALARNARHQGLAIVLVVVNAATLPALYLCYLLWLVPR